MPRKPNPPPAIFRIEGLSDGIDRRAVDDFTGLPLETVAKPVPELPEKPSKRMSRATGKVILQAAGMMPKPVIATPPKPVVTEVEGKRAAFVGKSITLHVALQPWRRDKF